MCPYKKNKKKPIDATNPAAFLFLKIEANPKTTPNVKIKTIERNMNTSSNFIS